MAEGDETACELVLFSCDSCYVYMVLPPVQGFPCVGGHSAAHPFLGRESVGAAQVPPARSSAGHRAQDWNVEQWLQEVTLRLAEQVCHCLYRPPPPLNPTCDCGVADGS